MMSEGEGIAVDLRHCGRIGKTRSVGIGMGEFTGNGAFAVIAGPCAVESEEQAVRIARFVKKAGAAAFRGGAYKPRTSPYEFQGLGRKGLEILSEVRREVGIPIVSEVVSVRDMEFFGDVDVLQIGARNMQNHDLLKEAAAFGKPILLKRGFCSTIRELLLSAEYIASAGNENIMLCERGIRTFDDFTRCTLDIGLVAAVHEISCLPIIADPSHAAGRASYVEALSLAAAAAGADGLMVEVHNDPRTALCDGMESLDFKGFGLLMERLKTLRKSIAVAVPVDS